MLLRVSPRRGLHVWLGDETGAAPKRFPIIGEERVCMKLFPRFMFFLLLVFSATSLFAGADRYEGPMNIGATVQVAGRQLQPGLYGIRWDGTGPTTQVSITREGKVVATIPARVVKLEQKSTQDVVELKTAGNGAKELAKIQFEGRQYALEIRDTTAAGGASSGSNLK